MTKHYLVASYAIVNKIPTDAIQSVHSVYSSLLEAETRAKELSRVFPTNKHAILEAIIIADVQNVQKVEYK